MSYDNNNRGALFANERKELETHPDYKGSAEIDGVEYWASAWINTAKNSGKKYLSLTFTRKNKRTGDQIPGGEDVPF
jgi:uncharacterized protein (DUF736 family)